MMRITRVRLVNFHNFVDEVVDVKDGGHLFLLGDNGSGKTTILDAVHYALSAGQLEFNAAARVGGSRNDGRTIQGIILRQDFERGVQNEGGAIAYAAVELWDDGAKRALTVGVGTEATTMDARVTKWGFITGRRLEDVPLVLEQGGERFAASRERLRASVGASDVFFRIGDYRAALAARLFGGAAAYDDVCRFWSMVKAYREIVAGARNFGALFRRLLPAPDAAVFGDIARSLQNLADMDAALRDLADQRGYVAGLLELARDVEREREVASRCRWLVCFRRRHEMRATLEASVQLTAELTAELERLGHEVDAADAGLELAETAVRAAEARDSGGIAQKLRQARVREAQARGDLAARERDAESALKLAKAANCAFRSALAELASLADGARDGLDRAIAEASSMPGDFASARKLSSAMRELGPSAWSEQADAAMSEARGLAATARRTLDDQLGRLERARETRERLAAELEPLRRQKEEQPRVKNFAAAVAALKTEGISVAPIYELLEPASTAPADALASIEALAGDAQLASLVVDPGDRGRAAQLIARRAPGVRVVVRTTSAALPAWASELFRDRDAAAVAIGALSSALAQAQDLGAIACPKNGVLDHRGMKFSADASQPRLLGRAARRHAHRQRVVRAEAALADAGSAVTNAATTAEIARERLARVDAVAEAVAGARSADLIRAESTRHEAERRMGRERELADVATAHADGARTRTDEAAIEVASLTLRAQSLDLDELQKRIRELGDIARAARKRCRELQSRHGVCASDIGREARKRAELEPRLVELGSEIGRLAQDVRRQAALADVDDTAVERYVRVEMRGDTFKSIATIEARQADAERRALAAASELSSDGSRGARNIHFSARFGFVYDETSNHIVDRRDQSAVGLLAELDRTLAEQRSVITAETRELMETLVVSGLARDLQGQVDTLERLVKNINRLLRDICFGRSEYQFRVIPSSERRELVDIVKRVSVLDADSRAAFRAWVEDRLEELRGGGDGEIPQILDYRNWFDYSLRMTTSDSEGIDLSRSVRALGSGGEQGVPNYLLVLALGKVMFETSGAKLSPLLLDEAFYGIDAGRRDQLLRFATELELQLFIASPDQDGVTPSARQATTLFIVKDSHGDVHVAPYHYWHRDPAAQGDLFAAPATEPDADSAECRTG